VVDTIPFVSQRQRRTRRPSADIRALVLDAARDLFLIQGFEATTTKQICERAGVAEPLLFRNFGSKTELFEIAVLAPIAEFVSDYATSWEKVDASAPEQRAETFVRGLHALAQRHRTVLLSALVQRTLEPNGERDVLDRVAATLQGLSGVSDLDRYDDVDPPAALAAALGMVLGVALLDDLLFPRGSRRPSRARLTSEMEKYLLYGTTRRGEQR
jgi:AcrR family transcriptional regulator